MTYGYMRALRGPRAPRRQHARPATAASRCGRAAWSRTSRSARRPASQAGMKRAVAGAEREQREGASGKWVAHWKMVHIVRPVWERVGQANQLGRAFPPLDYTARRRRRLMLLEPAPRTVRGARDLLSVALQYGNAFGQGFQAAALEAGRLLRQRRRALPDGGHGDRRDPPEHPVGVAAQERDAHRRRSGDRRRRRAIAFTPSAVRAAARRGIRQAADARATATSTTTRRRRRCRSRARSSSAYVDASRSSRRGTSTCSTSTSTTTISTKRSAASSG